MALYFKTKRLTINDYKTFEELITLFEDVFEEENVIIPKQPYLEDLLNKKDFVAFVATLNDKVVGGLTAYELKKYYTESSEIFIYDIAIDREHQRKGLGKMLMASLNEYCAGKGIKEIFVAANEEDVHAIDFYRSTGANAERVVHFNYSMNKRN